MHSGKSLVSIRGVGKIYAAEGNLEALPVLRGFTLDLTAGEVKCVIGPSGCGKTTLLNIIAGLEQPTEGTLVFSEGLSIANRTSWLAYMSQSSMLLPWRTVLDNVLLGSEISGTRSSETVERARALLSEFELDGVERAYPSQLSGGMRQRVALVRTLLLDVRVLLLDEPFASVDYRRRLIQEAQVAELVRTRALACLLVTHSIDEALAMADHIYVVGRRPMRIVADIPNTLPRNGDGLRDGRDSSEYVEVFQRIWSALVEDAPSGEENVRIAGTV